MTQSPHSAPTAPGTAVTPHQQENAKKIGFCLSDLSPSLLLCWGNNGFLWVEKALHDPWVQNQSLSPSATSWWLFNPSRDGDSSPALPSCVRDGQEGFFPSILVHPEAVSSPQVLPPAQGTGPRWGQGSPQALQHRNSSAGLRAQPLNHCRNISKPTFPAKAAAAASSGIPHPSKNGSVNYRGSRKGQFVAATLIFFSSDHPGGSHQPLFDVPQGHTNPTIISNNIMFFFPSCFSVSNCQV